ncbi:hypothetical protein BKA01_002412 [Pseudonocardia eucalypti]|uniref:hypothetical protein n=1 Tax=Pseudonocardia eucalypti TaxID=648755 RepID=UPI001618C45B|nr:hypothetical protein [Pseudonocardia eucalypti]
MRTIRVETELPTDADRVWDALRYPSTFLYVCRGLLGFPALAGRSSPMVAGERGSGWLLLFHVLPLTRHTIEVREVDPATMTIRTHEHDHLVQTWDHTLRVTPAAPGRCRYSDTVDIEAGRLTPLVALFGVAIYRYRHRRWRKLVRRHLTAPGDLAATA